MSKPQPLYPTRAELLDMSLNEYPQLSDYLGTQEHWIRTHWDWGNEFLRYIGRNKSEHTYVRFRNEVERFLLWAVLVKDMPIDVFKKSDVLEYADFCWKPPVSWIGTANEDRFIRENGVFKSNLKWRPFKMQAPKSQQDKTVDKKKYQPSQQTLSATFTAITSFYRYLMDEDITPGNPAQLAKKDCRHLIAVSQVSEVKRLSEEQWQHLLDTALEMANSNSNYERNLFLVAILKTLFLRISEVSERESWSPTMGHFWQDESDNWWLKIFGKGRKIRDITVPQDFLPYLERYRAYRNLSYLPTSNERSPLIEKLRGQGSMSSRHLSRLIQDVFEQAYIRMKSSVGPKKAQKLKEASTHWLRHTGASMEIERGRALKDLSEDLGHASMSTTDTIYVQTEHKKRADSGKSRKVK
ncbi:MAG: integrase [Alteromonadaceae bacterium]|nr:MAG: integrase [Alteromonadaceae bacterium]